MPIPEEGFDLPGYIERVEREVIARALEKTGNLDCIRPWILGLDEVFDRNNAGETEADNPGQALFLLSLVMCASMMPVEKLPPASWQSTFALGFISAVAFATILAVVAGLTLAGASAFSGFAVVRAFTSTTSSTLCGASKPRGLGTLKPKPTMAKAWNATDATSATCIEATSPNRSSR